MLEKNETFAHKLPETLIWIRILAAFCVYFGHMQLDWFAGLGSMFFLVLSGYTSTRLLLAQPHKDKGLSTFDFLKARLNKVYPPLLAALALNLSVSLYLKGSADYLQAFSSLTFTSNYYNAIFYHPDNGLSHLWTLSLIFQFYFIWALAYKALVSRKDFERKSNYLLSLTIIGVILYRFLLYKSGFNNVFYIYNSFETRVDALALGALLGLNIDKPFWTGVSTKLTSIFSSSLILCSIFASRLFSLSFRNTLGFTIQAFLMCFLILSIVGKNKSEVSIDKKKYMLKLSYISFLFYLYHPWAITLGRKYHGPLLLQSLFGAIFLLGFLTLYTFRQKIFAFCTKEPIKI